MDQAALENLMKGELDEQFNVFIHSTDYIINTLYDRTDMRSAFFAGAIYVAKLKADHG